jgi:hypothetical protein
MPCACSLRSRSTIVVLGRIEGRNVARRGDGHVVHRTLVDASLAFDKPVGLGIIGPGATSAQAEARTTAPLARPCAPDAARHEHRQERQK